MVEDAELVVSELVTNALLHGDTRCELRAALSEAALRLQVIDHGTGTPDPQSASDTDEHGRGLILVERAVRGMGRRGPARRRQDRLGRTLAPGAQPERRRARPGSGRCLRWGAAICATRLDARGTRERRDRRRRRRGAGGGPGRSPLTASRLPSALDGALGPLEAVHRLMTALQRAASPAGFYHEAVDVVVTTLGVDRASLLLFDPDGVMRFKAWRGLSDGYRRAVEGHTPWTPQDTDARPILVPEVAADPEFAGYLPTFRAEGIAALAFFPLLASGGVVGKFMLYYDRPHAFTPAEMAVAEILSANVALLLERHRADGAERAARAEAEAAHARLVSLQRVTTELTGAVRVDDVAAVVLGTALHEVGATTGSLCLIDGDELEIAYAVGYPADVMGRWGRFPLDAALPASEAARTGRAVFLRSPEERDQRYPVFAASPVVGDKAYAMIPLGGERPLGCLVIGFPEPRSSLDRDEPFFTELAARCAAALERARLFDDREQALQAEAAARQAAERASERVASLGEASAALTESLDYDETLRRVADAVVPRLADACAVYLKTDAGGLALAALRHRSPDTETHIRTVLERFPPHKTDRMGFGAVMRTATTEIYPEIQDEQLEAWSAYGGTEHLELLRAIDFGWLMVIPLVSRGQILGVLGLMNERGHALEDDAVSLANMLAARAATAIDNARLFRDRTAIAQQLQASLLPPQLPEIAGVDLAARYSAAGAGNEVGGDFYDVFPLDSRRFVAVLGDVCGRGLLGGHARRPHPLCHPVGRRDPGRPRRHPGPPQRGPPPPPGAGRLRTAVLHRTGGCHRTGGGRGFRGVGGGRPPPADARRFRRVCRSRRCARLTARGRHRHACHRHDRPLGAGRGAGLRDRRRPRATRWPVVLRRVRPHRHPAGGGSGVGRRRPGRRRRVRHPRLQPRRDDRRLRRPRPASCGPLGRLHSLPHFENVQGGCYRIARLSLSRRKPGFR